MGPIVNAEWSSEEGRSSDPTILDHIQREFAFLESEHGFLKTEPSMHFRGHSVTYRGRTLQIAVEFDPESTRPFVLLYPTADLVPGGHARANRVDQLLTQLEPNVTWRVADHGPPFSREEVSSAFTRWAAGLQRYAGDLLSGTDDGSKLRWGRAW
jgi:hypothetical protein